MALPLTILDTPAPKKEYGVPPSGAAARSKTASPAPAVVVVDRSALVASILKPTSRFIGSTLDSDSFSTTTIDTDTRTSTANSTDDEDDIDCPDSPRPGSTTTDDDLDDDTDSRDSFTGDEQVYVDVSSVPSYFPTHPIADMQAPFEESMLDAGRKNETANNYRESNPARFSGASRRSIILGQHGHFDNISYNAQWRANEDAKFHPIVKIMSQVIFGVHLLCQAMEQSIPEVSIILQGFVQELDGFLRRVNSDFDLSLKDVAELHSNLSLPLQHVNVFDQLLNDRKYRTQTLEGNIRIDGIIKRYSRLASDYKVDLTKLSESNVQFGAYLARIGDGWTRGSRELTDIHSAMCKNTTIWDTNVKALLEKANKLTKLLENSALCVFEFEKRCAAAARRSMNTSRGSSRMSSARTSVSRRDKPLPAVPQAPELALPPAAPPTTTPPVRQPVPAPSSSCTSATVRTRLARPAGLASRSMQDLKSAGFVGSTSELAIFLRTTAPDDTPPSHAKRPVKKKSLGSMIQAFCSGRNHSTTSLGDEIQRPRSAPNPGSAGHIPLSTFMNRLPLTPLSATSTLSKPQFRFDSVIGSGRQSRQSKRSVFSNGSEMSETSRGKLSFAFLKPFKL